MIILLCSDQEVCKKMQLLILIPVYNEWPHLFPVLKDLRRHFSNIMVVGDGSDNKSFLSHLRDDSLEYLNLLFNLGHWSIYAGRV